MKIKTFIIVVFMVSSGVLSADENTVDGTVNHIDQYIEKMRIEMEEIEQESNLEKRHQLMRLHMESMASALVTMQAEIQPMLNRDVGLHTGSHEYSDENIDASIDGLEESIRIRQMQAILEQMSFHQKALEDGAAP